MPLSMQKSELVGTFLESIFYGVFIISFIRCFEILRERHRKQLPSLYLSGTTALLFILITTHLVIVILRAVVAFTGDESNVEAAADYYGNLASFTTIFKTTVYAAITVISDAFILYRLFVVWNYSYFVCALPFLIFLADAATGIVACYSLSLLSADESFYVVEQLRRTQAFFSLTLGHNLICTSLIAYKIWRIQKQSAPYQATARTTLSQISVMLVESCAVYSAFLVVLIALYASDSTALFIVLDMTTPTIGIVFLSVVIRVGKGISHGDHATQVTSGTLRFGPHARTTARETSGSTSDQHQESLPLAIRAKTTDSDRSMDFGHKQISLTDMSLDSV